MRPKRATRGFPAKSFSSFGGAARAAILRALEPLEGRVLLAAQLVTDLLPGTPSSGLANFANFRHTLFFTGNDGAGHNGLWKSDGTAAGTTYVMSFPNATPNYGSFVPAGNSLYFVDNTNFVLWKTDGTAAGTAALRNFNPYHSAQGPTPSNLTAVGNELFFVVNDQLHGSELWESDGTTSGTKLVKDIAFAGNGSSPSELTNVNGTLFFYANDGAHGNELWKSDGTAAGTTLVKDIYPGVTGSGGTLANPTPSLTNVNGTLYLVADDGVNSAQIWKSDGTGAGTVRVTSLGLARPNTLAASPAGLLFSSDGGTTSNGLYVTDGTTATRLLDYGGTATMRFLAQNAGTGLFFTAASTGGGEYTFWRTDGTSDGTSEIEPFPYGSGFNQFLTGSASANGTYYFGAPDGSGIYQLWASDGTDVGTVPVTDGFTSATSSAPNHFITIDGALYFTAGTADNGVELWTVPSGAPAPAAPTTLTATAGSAKRVDLHWSDNSTTEAGFVLERSSSPSFATIDFTTTLLPDATNYSDTSVSASQAYYYRVRAYNASGQSAVATALPVTTPGGTAAPTLLKATTTGALVALQWQDNSSDETGFRVERSATSNFSGLDFSVELPAGTTSYNDATVSKFTTYYYRVYSEGPSGNSSPAVLQVTTGDTVPLAASNLQAAGVSQTANSLLWVDNSDNETFFRIDRAPLGGAFTTLATVSANQTSYFDANLGSLATWTYRVVALGQAGNALPSNTATATTLAPQLTTQVKDLNPTPAKASSLPGSPVLLGGLGYFCAVDNTGNIGLWVTGGTTATTTLVKELYPNVSGNVPGSMIVAGTTLYFLANNQGQLWKSDGTAAGTVMIKDTGLSYTGYAPGAIAAVNGKIVFTPNMTSVWASDGTTAGTAAIGTASSTSTSALVSSGGLVYFVGPDTPSGKTLWVTGGTAATTQVVKHITAGGPNSAQLLTPFKGGVVFNASDTASGPEPWFSDGTSAGTLRLADVVPGATGSFAKEFTVSNGVAYFATSDPINGGGHLYRTDGTAAGTTVVRSDLFPSEMADVNGTLYFVVDGATAATLYKSDGTAAGTAGVQVFNNASGQIFNLTNVNGKLYLVNDSGQQLYVTDGTTTTLLHSWSGGNFTPGPLAAFNGALIFSADDGVSGDELWTSDGTPTGTVQLKDINVQTADSLPDNLTAFNGSLFYTADDGTNGLSLFRTDGTSAGTVRLGGATGNLAVFNGSLYYSRFDAATGNELWRTDGTSAGAIVADATAGSGSTAPQHLTPGASLLYFQSASTLSLWVTDGVPGGTTTRLTTGGIASVNTTGLSALPVTIGNRIYFNANATGFGNELWSSDGTVGGTGLLADLVPGATGSSPYGFTNLNGTLMFGAGDGAGRFNLYASNGTAGGTVAIKSFKTLGVPVVFNGALYFYGDDGVHNAELWRSDGTTAGTYAIADTTQAATFLTPAGNTLFFKANAFLWASDGTAAGTYQVSAISTSTSFGPAYVVNGNGTLYFHNASGLWKSDGTFNGTYQVMTVDATSNPPTFTGAPAAAVGDRLYFSAYEPNTGRELWSLSNTPPAAPTGLQASGLQLGAALTSSFTPAVTTASTQLTWVDQSNNESGFAIDRSTAADFSTIDQTFFVTANTTTYTDTTGIAGTAYYYRVRAVNAGGVSASSGLAASTGATYTITGPANAQTLAVTAGTISLNADLGLTLPNVTLSVSSGASAVVNVSQHLGALMLTGGGTVKLAQGGAVTVVTNGLSITGNASLDVADDHLVVNYSAAQEAATLSSVTGLITSGLYDGPRGFWDGPGVSSSVAAGDAKQLHSLGVVDNNDGSGNPVYPTFGGQTVGGRSLLIGYTLFGDADLNGVVNPDDFTQFLAGFHHQAAAGWLNGDFDYNGVVNPDDFTLLLGGIKASQGSQAAAMISAGALTLSNGSSPAGTAAMTGEGVLSPATTPVTPMSTVVLLPPANPLNGVVTANPSTTPPGSAVVSASAAPAATPKTTTPAAAQTFTASVQTVPAQSTSRTSLPVQADAPTAPMLSVQPDLSKAVVAAAASVPIAAVRSPAVPAKAPTAPPASAPAARTRIVPVLKKMSSQHSNVFSRRVVSQDRGHVLLPDLPVTAPSSPIATTADRPEHLRTRDVLERIQRSNLLRDQTAD